MLSGARTTLLLALALALALAPGVSPAAGKAADADAVVFVPALDPSTILPGADVAAFAQDTQGFLWMATDGGLARWDGTTLSVIDADPGSEPRLPQFGVTDVAADPRAGVWAAAGELVRVDPWSNEITRTGVPAETLAARGHRIWVVGSGPLQVLDSRTGAFTRVRDVSPSRADGAPLPAEVDAHGRLYAGLDWGVQIIELDGGERSVVIPGGVSGMAVRRGGGVWVTSPSGLWRVSAGPQSQPIHVAQPSGADLDPSSAVVELDDGSVMIGQRRAGLSVYAPNQPSSLDRPGGGALRYGLPDSGISVLFADRQGGIWASAFEAGLYRDAVDSTPAVRSLHPARSRAFGISDLHGDARGIWVAAGTEGLRRFDPESDRWSGNLLAATGEGGVPAEILALAPAPGGLWLAEASGGLSFRDHETGEVIPLPLLGDRRVNDVVTDPSGALWVLVENFGVEVLDQGGRPLFRLAPGGFAEIVNDRPRSVLAGRDSAWIGGTRGLERVDLSTGVVEQWSSAQGDLVGDTVFDIIRADEGRLWLATSAGIELFDPDIGRGIYFGRDAGLPGTTAVALRRHQELNALWVATSRGLALFDLERRETTAVYTTADGLEGNTFAAHGSAVLPDGRIYFGNTRGLVEVARGAGVGSGLDADVHVTGVFVDGRRVDPTERLILDRGSTVRFEFSLPEFSDPLSVRFRYRLTGSSDRWREVNGGERSVSFPDLGPGLYRFEVEARALGSTDLVRTGELSDVGGAISFSLARPLWQHPLTIASAALALIILGAALNYRRAGRAGKRARELEELVSTRTEELAHAAMVAEQANESKSRFLTMISHELRSPLHALMGYAELIEASTSDDALKDWAGNAVAAGSHLGGMIEDLLAVARENEFASDTTPHRVEIATFLRQTVDMSRRANGNAPEVGLHTGELRPYYSINERRVRQLLVNLLDNAIKHCDKRVDLRVERVGAEGEATEVVRFAVADDGPGIPEGLRAEIFQPFYRGPDSSGSGLGLGLAVSAQIAEMLGSELKLDDAGGDRTRFWFDLRTEPLAAGSAPDSSQGSGRVALVVDDELASRTVVSEYLRSLGYEVVSLASGAQALDRLEFGDPPDAVVTDHLMPAFGGPDVAAGVRRIRHLDGVPVIAVTAAPEDAAAVAEYDAVLGKPVSRAALERALSRQLAEVRS